jgi:hypothetical protein
LVIYVFKGSIFENLSHQHRRQFHAIFDLEVVCEPRAIGHALRDCARRCGLVFGFKEVHQIWLLFRSLRLIFLLKSEEFSSTGCHRSFSNSGLFAY